MGVRIRGAFAPLPYALPALAAPVVGPLDDVLGHVAGPQPNAMAATRATPPSTIRNVGAVSSTAIPS